MGKAILFFGELYHADAHGFIHLHGYVVIISSEKIEAGTFWRENY